MNLQILLFLNQLKNASLASLDKISIIPNKSILKIVEILYLSGLIQSFLLNKSPISGNNNLIIFLKYGSGRGLLDRLDIVSTLSRERKVSHRDIYFLNQSNKVFVVSTSRGILSLEDCIKHRVGGIVLFCC